MAARAPLHPPEEHLPHSWDFDEGEQIVPGRYALEALGGGVDTEAYLAWDERLYSLVVVKIVRPHRVGDPRAMRRLVREAGLLGRLAHPVILRGFGSVLEGPRPHLVLEHLEGPPLSETLDDFGSLELEQLLPLAFQIASGLQYLANAEVVHLDVKPHNIILGVPPQLIDLSVARSVQDALSIDTPIGTDAYMAPEQCNPALAPIGPAADVWGLGATLFESICGTLPFSPAADVPDDDPAKRWPQLTGHPGELPEACPADLEAIVLDCLSFEPASRPRPADIASRLEPLVGAITTGRILGRTRPSMF